MKQKETNLQKNFGINGKIEIGKGFYPMVALEFLQEPMKTCTVLSSDREGLDHVNISWQGVVCYQIKW